MSTASWRPTASIENLKQRAAIIRTIREFFAERNVLEVETPVLSLSGVTDPFIHNLTTDVLIPGQGSLRHYLQTSPEYHMKRLLAAGSGCIYQICKAFRDEEGGRFHSPEFTMLEWYRIGFTHHDLMDEMDSLLQPILQTKPATRLTYQDMFLQYCDIDPLTATLQTLRERAAGYAIDINAENMNTDDWLNVILTHVIEPKLGEHAPVFIYDYPASQAALAKIQGDIAERFEVYYRGIELANGFHELQNATEQASRFIADGKKAEKLGYHQALPDQRLLQALECGLPACSGVALGLDRLIMLALGKSTIQDVMTFSGQAV